MLVYNATHIFSYASKSIHYNYYKTSALLIITAINHSHIIIQMGADIFFFFLSTFFDENRHSFSMILDISKT